MDQQLIFITKGYKDLSNGSFLHRLIHKIVDNKILRNANSYMREITNQNLLYYLNEYVTKIKQIYPKVIYVY